MKTIKFLFGAVMVCVLSVSFVGCDNVCENASSDIDNQSSTLSEPTTRSGELFQVLNLPVGQKLYRANQTASINWSAIRNEPVTDDDWGNALYFFDEDIRNYLDSDHPYFIESALEKTFPVIDTDYEGFMDGEYDLKYVVAQIEALIGSSKPADTPFLLWLGEMGYGFRYYENLDREVAVVIPHSLLADDLFSQKMIATYN